MNPIQGLQMNMSTCSLIEGWWGVVPISPGFGLDDVRGVTIPTLQLSFDDSSASFSVQSSIVANTFVEGDKNTPDIYGKLTIEFLGNADAARSDILNKKTPVTWTATMGFGNNSLSLDYESAASAISPVNTCQVLGTMAAVLVYMLI